jgi:hypothetical protein
MSADGVMLFAGRMRERLMVAGVPSLERQQVLSAPGSSGRGLSDEAAARRAEIGANQLPTGCGHLKTGAPARGERVVKYNRLLEIAATVPTLRYGMPVG